MKMISFDLHIRPIMAFFHSAMFGFVFANTEEIRLLFLNLLGACFSAVAVEIGRRLIFPKIEWLWQKLKVHFRKLYNGLF